MRRRDFDFDAYTEAMQPKDEAKHSDVQTSKHLNVQAPTSVRTDLAKSKDPEYVRTTVYLKVPNHKRTKTWTTTTEDGRDMSDLVNDLLEEYFAKSDA